MDKTSCLSLNSGEKMPIIGLGTWMSPAAEVKTAVESAIDAGYRHIDCALLYGNEEAVGEGIRSKIQQGIIKREDIFVTSKLWCTYFRRVRQCLTRSLKMLKLDYVDLYLIHYPAGFQYSSDDVMFPTDKNGDTLIDEDIHYVDVYKELEKLQKEGLVKSIGMSNFNGYQIEKVCKECEITPAINQIEMHPYLDQTELLEICAAKGIAVTAYSPFASPARPWAKSTEPTPLLDHLELKRIACEYGKTPAQLILRYIIQHGVIVIPKSVNPERIKANIDVFDFEVTDEDMTTIRKLHCGFRAYTSPDLLQHKYYPYKENYTE